MKPSPINDIEYICTLHEQAAAIAAESYARLTNNIGLAVVTSGPGGTNTITGVDEVTNITVWSYGVTISANKPEINIDMGGLEGYEECNLPAPTDWTSNSFDGNWTQEDY